MKLTLLRFRSGPDDTLGLLFIDNVFTAFTLEDEYRAVKVPGETRIPAGVYRLVLRRYGRNHEKYQQRFPEFHIGMLEVKGVPGFSDILFHMGNREADTAGCLLVGEGVLDQGNGTLLNSARAYEKFYRQEAPVVERKPILLEIRDSPVPST